MGGSAGFDPHEVQELDGFVFDAVHHVLEHDVGFLLVFNQRIFLTVAAKIDAFLEMIHR